jgi:hypothetical protein
MLDKTSPHTLAGIGHNNPPGAIELAKPIVAELGKLLERFPVITNEEESREAKAIQDRVVLALHGVERERDGKVRPHNEEVAAINAEYHKWHNTNDKKPGLWNTLVRELRIRLTKYARAEEDKRQAAAKAAREALEKAEREAREAEEAAWQAKEEAEAGVCDVDIASAIEAAQTTSARATKARGIFARAERDTKVRIVGGIGKAISLHDDETLIVTDWKAAISQMIDDDGDLPKDITEAILKAARAYRKAFRELPNGITATFDRSL